MNLDQQDNVNLQNNNTNPGQATQPTTPAPGVLVGMPQNFVQQQGQPSTTESPIGQSATQPMIGNIQSNQMPQTQTAIGKNQGKFNKLLIIGAVVVLVVIVTGVAYSAISKKSPKTELSGGQSTTTVPQETPEQKPAEEKAEKSEVAVNKVVGGDLGKTVTVTKIVRNFPDDDIKDGNEGVLVEVRVETDGTYTGTPGRSDFRLVIDGKEYRIAYLITGDDITKGGYLPYDLPTAKKGQPAVGYLAFEIPTKSSNVTFRYHRGETKILGGEKLAAKDFDTVIF